MRGIASNRLHTRLFFVLIFSLSWGFWVLAALSSTKGEALPIRLLHYAGGLMPVAVTIALIYLRCAPQLSCRVKTCFLTFHDYIIRNDENER